MIHFMLDDLGDETIEALPLFLEMDILIPHLDFPVPCCPPDSIQRQAPLFRFIGVCFTEDYGAAIYQLMVDIFKFPRFFYPDLLMALA